MRVTIPTLRELLTLGTVVKAEEYQIKSAFRQIGRKFPTSRLILYNALENFDCFQCFIISHSNHTVLFESWTTRDKMVRVSKMFKEWRGFSSTSQATGLRLWSDNVPKPMGQSAKVFWNESYNDMKLPYRIHMTTWWNI